MAQGKKNNGGKKLPSHIRYSVPEREGAPWSASGSLASPGRQGLQRGQRALPAPGAVGHVVLRAYEPKDDEAQG